VVIPEVESGSTQQDRGGGGSDDDSDSDSDGGNKDWSFRGPTWEFWLWGPPANSLPPDCFPKR